ncbi:MAG: DNA helicase RecQ [Synergistaceae bacterium]|jgi:ATP-dependent DNA helicase RecQ|nr:DNA helicase RecQ [Synergistaceae bacterium]
MTRPLEALKRVFGYGAFRPGQEEIVETILSGRDVLGIMPTGAGKSICYQIPAIVNGGISIVLSPLISLMKDQVDALRQNGVNAASINSSMEWDDVLEIFRAARRGDVTLLYVAPERLDGEGFREFLSSLDVSMVVVDEAHCVTHWGHDFRPAYLNIAPAVSSLAKRPVLAAFTATATPEARTDIIRQLALASPFVKITGLDRSNLFFQVEHPLDKTSFLLDYAKKFPEMPGIVYCSTRRGVEETCVELKKNGVNAVRYHAGLDDSERFANQESFIYDRASVMVATNAFGMGIDKSNVRYVIHYNMPGSIDSYYQEAGRAGRDGSPADCLLLFGKGDISTARFLISKSDDAESKRSGFRKLQSMVDYCNTESCLRRHILNYFGENSDLREHDGERRGCGNCSNCTSIVERSDITVEAQKIISCVYRMSERTGGKKFGSPMLADVLKGARTEKALAFGFDKISTWGLMKGHSANSIKDMVNFLVAEKYLTVGDGEFPTLSFTKRTFPFLKGKSRLMMKKHEEKRNVRSQKQESRPKTDGRTRLVRDTDNSQLFEELRALRRELSASEGVPPYVVFSDRALAAMCNSLPATGDEFLAVPGVGAAKLEKYGDVFLEAIKEWKEEND